MAQEGKLINELRVVELRQELASRGLDKSGNKATLLERLKEALLAEGINADEHKFDVSLKKPGETEPNEEEMNADDSLDLDNIQDAKVLDVVPDANGLLDSPEHPAVAEADITLTEETKDEPKVKDETTVKEEPVDRKETTTAVSYETKEHREAPDIKVKKEDCEDDVKEGAKSGALKNNTVPVNTGTINTEKLNEENKENVLREIDAHPPTPTSVAPLVEFTSADTIQMDTSADRKEDDISLIVHVDETMNEFDDLISNTSHSTTQDAKGEDDVTGAAGDEATGGGENGEEKMEGATTASTTSDKLNDSTSQEENSALKDSTSAVKKSKPGENKSDDKSKSSSRNLWISGLANTTRATDLKTLFSKYGKVAGAKVVTNARSPMSKCYGFVTMNSVEEASKCIEHLHRTELQGRMISVERAKADPSQGKVSPTKKESDKKASDKKRDVAHRREPEKRTRGAIERRRLSERSSRRHDSHRTRCSRDYHSRRSSRPPSDKDSSKKEADKKESDKKDADKKEGDKKDADKKEGEKKEAADKTTEEKTKEQKKPESGEEKSEEGKKDESKDTKEKEKSSGDEKEKTKSSDKKEEVGKKKDGEKKSADEKRHSKSRTKDRDMLSLNNIKEERERERQRIRERRIREGDRRRRDDYEARLLHRQRTEAIQLQRERDRLRIERERLEHEKLAAERERILLEREKRERERAELSEQRRLEALRYEERQRSLKRPYDRPPVDDYWGEPKRAAYDPVPPPRFSEFDRDARGPPPPPRGAPAPPAYSGRDPGYGDRGAPRDYDRPPARDAPPPRYDERREDRDRRDRDRDDRLAPSDRYNRYEAERRGSRDRPAVPPRGDHGSSSRGSGSNPNSDTRHDSRRVASPPSHRPRDPSPARSRGKSREAHRSDTRGSGANDRTYNHSSGSGAGAGRDSWAPPPARRSHDKDAGYVGRTSMASVPTSMPSAGLDKHSSWQDPGRLIVPAPAARPGSQWVTTSAAALPSRTIISQPMLQPQHPAAGHPQFLISAANIISAGLGAGLAKPEAPRYSVGAYNPPRRY